jgi:antitoxin component YwqK of YwqJK toxin-antitoxin module
MRNLKLHQMLLLCITQFLFLMNGTAQYKNFKIGPKGDTLNAIDKKDLKQGKWVIHVDEIRGEPGYEEEGIFKAGNKEGIWRRYNLSGDIIAVENYKLGGKDGIQQYYSYLGDLQREESWRGYNPDAPYDTVAVYGTGSGQIESYKIVKAEQYSVKHGTWKYFDETGKIAKTFKYDRGKLESEKSNTIAPKVVSDSKKIEKTPEMLEWERKNKGKKRVVRDGRTGGK